MTVIMTLNPPTPSIYVVLLDVAGKYWAAHDHEQVILET